MTDPFFRAVSIAGRIMTPSGTALRNVAVSMTDEAGTRRTATTGSFGTFQFTNVPAGPTYTFSASSKCYRFAPRQVLAQANISDLNFVGLE